VDFSRPLKALYVHTTEGVDSYNIPPVFYEIQGSFLVVQERFEHYKRELIPAHRIIIVIEGGKYE